MTITKNMKESMKKDLLESKKFLEIQQKYLDGRIKFVEESLEALE